RVLSSKVSRAQREEHRDLFAALVERALARSLGARLVARPFLEPVDGQPGRAERVHIRLQRAVEGRRRLRRIGAGMDLDLRAARGQVFVDAAVLRAGALVPSPVAEARD